MSSKVQMNWEILKEQEIEFRKGMSEFVNGIETELFFQGLRQTEYRRGKEEKMSNKNKEFLICFLEEYVWEIDDNGDLLNKLNDILGELKND